MPAPEGRVLLNLDEFMLRLGHLSVLMDVALELGGNEYRVLEELSERLTRLVSVSETDVQNVAEYLAAKSLCDVLDESGNLISQGRGRYRELHVRKAAGHAQLEADNQQPPRVWWQDLMLSFPDVPSRVGAVTVGAKSGSKTGLSHILDWGVLLDLVSRSADLQPEGRLVARLRARARHTTPYRLGIERIVYAWCYLRADFDVFSRLVLALSERTSPVKRKDATLMFADVVRSLAEDAEGARSLSNSQKETIFEALRDLERAAKGEGNLGTSSTAWHRTSSRFETLVDLGLLTKGSSERTYEYYYLPTEKLNKAARTLDSTSTCRDWVNQNLFNIFGPPINSSSGFAIDDELLWEAIALIGSGSPLVAIDHLSLALGIASAERGVGGTLAELRNSILDFAREHPEVARLSSGRYGREAEFISVRRRPA